MRNNVIVFSVGMLLSPLGFALEQEADDPWRGEASLTYIINSGNSESETLGAKVKAVRDTESWRFTYKLEGMNESTEGVRTQEKYFGSAKADKKLGKASYLFGLIEHSDDRFSGYEYQSSVSFGYGHTMIDNEIHRLFLEAGPGYRRNKLEEPDEEQTADGDEAFVEVEEEAMLRLALDYDWQISESTKFSEEVSADIGEELTIAKSSTQLKTKINSRLAMTLGYDVKHTSEVPEETEKTDSTAYVSLDYSF